MENIILDYGIGVIGRHSAPAVPEPGESIHAGRIRITAFRQGCVHIKEVIDPYSPHVASSDVKIVGPSPFLFGAAIWNGCIHETKRDNGITEGVVVANN